MTEDEVMVAALADLGALPSGETRKPKIMPGAGLEPYRSTRT